MLKVDLKKIKQDAEKVDPQWYEVCRKESWVIKRWHECGGETDLFETPDSRFAKHIENTNPENTLALVAEIQRLQALVEQLGELVEQETARFKEQHALVERAVGMARGIIDCGEPWALLNIKNEAREFLASLEQEK